MDALRHIVSDKKEELPAQVRHCVENLLEHVTSLEDKIAEYDRTLSRVAKTDLRNQKLMGLKGIGPATACVLIASKPVSQ